MANLPEMELQKIVDRTMRRLVASPNSFVYGPGSKVFLRVSTGNKLTQDDVNRTLEEVRKHIPSCTDSFGRVRIGTYLNLKTFSK